MPFQVGQRIGDYEVQKMLGVGGMGHVYRVRNIISNRTEAMKVLLPDLTAEPDLATRFIAEIRTLASFDHPNIAQLHTALIAENQLIMMMEYVEGYTLEQLAKQRAMPMGEVAGYISQALSALGYAHNHGVVHRDVKPANLMVTSHGILKLMDFGIAKSKVENNNYTMPGTTLGSLYYMSPEQVRGDTVDARSDIYSVGIVLYELLAGRRPFEAETTFTILNKQLNEPPQPPIELNPAIPAGLNAIILMALSKDPAQRFQNAEAFRNALKSYCTAPDGQAAGVVEPAAIAPAAVAAAAGGFAPVAMPSSSSIAAASPAAPSSATPFGATAVMFPPAGAAPASSLPPAQTAPPSSAPPAYAEIPQAQGAPVYAAAKAPRSNKPLWIATGAIAAVLALVAVGIAGPHWMKTHAAGSAAPVGPAAADAATPAPASDTTAANPSTTDNTAASPTASNVTAGSSAIPQGAGAQGTGAQGAGSSANPVGQQPSVQPGAGTGEDAARLKERKQAEERKQMLAQQAQVQQMQAQQQVQAQQMQAQQQRQQEQQRMREQEQRAAAAEGVSRVQERYVDMNARATTARRQVGQIRRQQEASGLGLRGDVESAESRLDTYLHAANNDIERGDAIAARQDLNKAEPELNTLERFLGH